MDIRERGSKKNDILTYSELETGKLYLTNGTPTEDDLSFSSYVLKTEKDILVDPLNGEVYDMSYGSSLPLPAIVLWKYKEVRAEIVVEKDDED